VYLRDSDDRKRVEGALQTNEHASTQYFSSMYSAVLLVTDEGRVEFVIRHSANRFGSRTCQKTS